MSDQDFNFSPQPPRRERKEFEPPPWEERRIDEAPRRESEQGITAEQNSTLGEQAAVKISPDRTATDPDPDVGRIPRSQESPVDENNVTAMLFELKAEDPSAGTGFNRVGLAAGLLLLALGALFVIWGTVMVVIAFRAGQQATGVLIGFMVLMVGAGIAGTGAWLVFKSLRQQGVL